MKSEQGHSPDPTPLREKAERLESELADLYFRLLEQRKAAAGERFPSAKAALRLSLDLSPPGSEAAEGRLYAELLKAADRCVEEKAPFPIGRVYCHWCRASDCAHASPPDSRSVFRGYTATGQPLWQEFVSVLLERRHPRVDAVVSSDPSPVSLVQQGYELSMEQLAVYGKRSPVFQILAQTIIGYVPLGEGARAAPSRGGGSVNRAARTPVALTFQAVLVGGGARPPILNILGTLPDGTPAFQALEESPDARVADALRSVRRSLEELTFVRANVRRRKAQGERRRRAAGILARLARNLERIFRQQARRTIHGNDRHRDRGRPASTALRDALEARAESIFRDVEAKTWVILGPKSRVHVFNDAALHVTSVTYPGETVRQRTTRGKWLPPRQEELSAFRRALEERSRVER